MVKINNANKEQMHKICLQMWSPKRKTLSMHITTKSVQLESNDEKTSDDYQMRNVLQKEKNRGDILFKHVAVTEDEEQLRRRPRLE